MAGVRVVYYTDPACPWSWGAEPALRELELRFGDGLSVEYVMSGYAREFERPLDELRAWLDAAARSAMPVDPRLWLDAPPRSSYPACMAVKAAAEQGLDGAYLRRARIAIACERRRLDANDVLVELARAVPGLDVERFQVDLASHVVVEAFGADLERARAAGAGANGDRPVLEFERDGSVQRVAGGPAAAWSAAAESAGAQPLQRTAPDVEQALRRYGRLATAEVAIACALPGPRAAAELWRLAGEWRVVAERQLSGELWALA